MLPKTKEVLDLLSKDEFFETRDIKFVGGTALSYRINHRLSEDIDFAVLKLNSTEIDKLMKKYGAVELEHGSYLEDTAKNDGENIKDSYIKYNLDGVKVEFFVPPFNLLEEEVWREDKYSFYGDTKLKIASFKTIAYMKTMAFWNRKKYRDLYDIYYIIENDLYSTKVFLEKYMKYNITYNKEFLLEKIKSKAEFYLRPNDEGINTLVDNPQSYEWYRAKIEEFVYQDYLEDLYGLISSDTL